MNAFYQTVWAKIKVGDAVLMTWGAAGTPISIVEVVITANQPEINKVNGRLYLIVDFTKDGRECRGRLIDPDDKVYYSRP
jgi:hypothetical protein